MKIKQIGPYNGNIISTILKNRGIEDIESFLNPDFYPSLNPFSLERMKDAVNLLIKSLNENKNIFILVDSDADGFTSSSIIYQYIKKISPQAKLNYFLHDRKAHGLTNEIMKKILDSNVELLIIPDAASNDVSQIKKLKNNGIDIIILDHHEVDKFPKNIILVNNQLDTNDDTNKNLVGAGIVLKFCEAIDEILGVNYSKYFYDLAAIGQVGDSSDISDLEIRNIVLSGLSNINNPLLKIVLKDCYGSLNNICSKDLSFSIIPMINSIVRIGNIEERDLLFRAINMIDSDQYFLVEKRKKNKKTGSFEKYKVNQSFFEYVYDIMKKVRGRQNSMTKKALNKMKENIYNDGGIVIGILETKDEASITGLIANKISSKYQKPALVLFKENGKYKGSGRGNEKILTSFRDWCNDTGLVEFAQGHANAFGISIPEKNFKKFVEKTFNVEKNEPVYEVDLIINDKVDKQPIIDSNENKNLFGGKVSDPLFAYLNIRVRKDFIRQKGSMITFYENGVEFVMFNAPEGLYESLTYNFDEYVFMDFVGTPSENIYSYKHTPRIILEDCEKHQENLEYEEVPDEVTEETIYF